MKKVLLIIAAVFIFSNTALFSLDCYSYNLGSNLRYAIAITQSKDHENEYVVGLMEVDSAGDTRWTVSTRTVIENENTFVSKIDLNFPEIYLRENYIEIEINKKNNVILKMNRVDKLSFKNCDVMIPEVFY